MPIENHFEDFVVGSEYSHHWGRTIYATESAQFATMMMHYNPAYFNREYAQHLGYRDLVIDPYLVLATIIGLSVEDNSEGGGPFLGLTGVRFLIPVYAGDTLYAESRVESKRPTASRPGWGIVIWHTIGRNQDGKAVIELQRSNLTKLRDGPKT